MCIYEWFVLACSLLLLWKLAEERGAILNLGVIIVTLRSLTIRMIPALVAVVPATEKATHRVVFRIVVITHPDRNRALWYGSGCRSCSLCARLDAHGRLPYRQILLRSYRRRSLGCRRSQLCCCYVFDTLVFFVGRGVVGHRIDNFYCSWSA